MNTSEPTLPAVTMRERPDTDADLGTLHVNGERGFSGVSCWSPRQRGPLWSLRLVGLVPVELLRRRIRRRFETRPSEKKQIHKKTQIENEHLQTDQFTSRPLI